MQDILQACAESVVQHLDAALARIWTLHAAQPLLELQASAGLYTHLDGAHRRIPVGQFKIGLIASERRPHLTNAVRQDPRVHDQAWAQREGIVAFAGYPLLVEDRLVGVLGMFAREPLSDVTLQALESVASGIAMSIDRKRAEQALIASEAKFRRLAERSFDLIFATDTGGVIQYVSPSAERIFGMSPEAMLGRHFR